MQRSPSTFFLHVQRPSSFGSHTLELFTVPAVKQVHSTNKTNTIVNTASLLQATVPYN